jgi:two-component system, NtrC family, sensor kinase
MLINLKTKIWLTVFTIVLMFSFFTLYYFPAQQRKLLIKSYSNEVQNLANTVALGVKIAIKEQDYTGVETAMEFVKNDPRLKFVSMLQSDTTWNDAHTNYTVKVSVFKTFPENQHPTPTITSNDSIIVKQSAFVSPLMSGSIMLAFTTREIVQSQKKIRATSLIASGMVLLIGIILGFWLAKTISVPVMELRNAAAEVGKGDLTQRIKITGNDEIGELGRAFNRMVAHLALTRKELNESNISLSEANASLNATLSELKSTQVQLIQSEKLASLGELTAGIAHEIQNPLNFVNNFSEINTDMIAEMKDQLNKGNYDEVKCLADDIEANEEKITHHGKRADAIVKGMLQHSRSSTGEKEPTDINALADEFLRLAYHGLRAKDKCFNSDFKKDFDESIGKINIVPQDMGRVLLNLFNNAFYAVNEKQKIAADLHRPTGYQPLVSVQTKKTGEMVEIKVSDNGNGIPKNIIDKIFQPFFTSKPTGQGTGLGLSLAYEIIKTHGGTIKVETKEGEGTEFIILLPDIRPEC